MRPTEDEMRAKVVQEALSWKDTPYIPRGMVKGPNGGCDCLTFLAQVYERAGIIDALPIPHYARDFFLHDDFEFYLLGKGDTPGVLHFCEEIFETPKPADVVLWKFGKSFSHAAIVIEWPVIIHAFAMRPVSPDNAEVKSVLKRYVEVKALRGQIRPRRFFTVKDWYRGIPI